ncbi:hypothetical protein PVV74_11835 [Roseovarius sp. SK2]|uniref:hypothetical protein n=1 Tax=Roseovarius TaxID=74030 RepID=UPI00237A3FB6|nr:hypothetical protein [Roseovarius sp. SK2]MDD9726148.1 hypothetical protein [Roseovarius sp. SK2]
MAITPLPTPPSRDQDSETFTTNADAFLAALPDFATEANALQDDVNSKATAAAASQAAAESAETVAVGAANYKGDYDAGTTYSVGESVTYNGTQYIAKTENTGVTPANGANWLELVESSGGLVFLASSDLSSDATSDFTAFDAGLYDAYEFVFQNIIPATDDVDFTFLSSTDGGSTWDNTSGDYDFGCIILRSGTVFDTDSGNAASIALTGTGALTIGNTSGYPGLSGRLFVPGPHLAKKTQFLWNTSFYDPSGNLVMLTGSGLRQSEADVDAVRFLCSSGNIASGTITMYGMVNA